MDASFCLIATWQADYRGKNQFCQCFCDYLSTFLSQPPISLVCDKFMSKFSRRPMLPKTFPTIAQDTAAQGDNTVCTPDRPVHTQ
jgi:hypothetical protein